MMVTSWETSYSLSLPLTPPTPVCILAKAFAQVRPETRRSETLLSTGDMSDSPVVEADTNDVFTVAKQASRWCASLRPKHNNKPQKEPVICKARGRLLLKVRGVLLVRDLEPRTHLRQLRGKLRYSRVPRSGNRALIGPDNRESEAERSELREIRTKGLNRAEKT